jgi:outer membrane protein assembly factor BamD
MILFLGSSSHSSLPNSNLHKYCNKDARELLVKSEAYLHNGDWQKGREVLRYIEDYLPSSPELPIAKLALADSFFFCPDNSYPEAILEYTNYLKFFPNSNKQDYALYHIGLCHYASIGKLGRDQGSTRSTIETFQKLLKEAPNSIYARDAEAKIFICRHRLAETGLRIGIYYVKIFKYKAAENRIKHLLDTYQDCIDYKRAYYFLAEALYKNATKTTKGNLHTVSPAVDTKSEPLSTRKSLLEASIYYKKLIEKYPNGHLAMGANERLVEIKQYEIKQETAATTS